MFYLLLVTVLALFAYTVWRAARRRPTPFQGRTALPPLSDPVFPRAAPASAGTGGLPAMVRANGRKYERIGQTDTYRPVGSTVNSGPDVFTWAVLWTLLSPAVQQQYAGCAPAWAERASAPASPAPEQAGLAAAQADRAEDRYGAVLSDSGSASASRSDAGSPHSSSYGGSDSGSSSSDSGSSSSSD